MDTSSDSITVTPFRINVSNSFSLIRIVLSPFLLIPAWLDEPEWFLYFFTFLYITDFFDGFFARILHQMSELGTKLDSYGDLAMYFFGGIGMWMLWPDVVRREWVWVTAIIVSYIIPDIVGFLRWRRLTSYHTLGDKLSMVVVGGSAIFLFAWDIVWPFHLAAIMMVLAGLEEIAITLLLPKWTTNVPTVWHALRERKRDRNQV